MLKEPRVATAEELRGWINARVAARYQQVHDVVVVDDLPRSVAGKTLKRVLREQYGGQYAPIAARPGTPV